MGCRNEGVGRRLRPLGGGSTVSECAQQCAVRGHHRRDDFRVVRLLDLVAVIAELVDPGEGVELHWPRHGNAVLARGVVLDADAGQVGAPAGQ